MITLMPITRLKTLVLLPKYMLSGCGIVLKVALLWILTGQGKDALKLLIETQKVMSMAVFSGSLKIILTGTGYNGNRYPWY